MSGRALLRLAIGVPCAVAQIIGRGVAFDPQPIEPPISDSAIATARHVDAALFADADTVVLEALINGKIRY